MSRQWGIPIRVAEPLDGHPALSRILVDRAGWGFGMKARLIEWREIGPNTRHFEFESPDWKPAFVPGQFLSVTATIGEDEITRAYSMVSAPGGNGFALCANLVQEGRLSPWLFALLPGDEIDFKGPYGGVHSATPGC